MTSKPPTPLPAPESAPPRIRAALVGVSGYGRWHLLMAMEQALMGRLDFVGVVIINPNEEAALCARFGRQGIPVFPTFEAMLSTLAGKVDLILLPTGIQWHAPMARAALAVGAHVLVEKPVTATLQDVDLLIAEQARQSRQVAVGFQELYVAPTHEIKQRLLSGAHGRLQRITVRGQWPRAARYYRRNDWAGRLRDRDAWVLDSPINNAFAHFVMLALFWAGSSPETGAQVTNLSAELYRTHDIESFDTVCFRAATAGEVEILCYATHAGREDRPPEITIETEHATIHWTYEKEFTIDSGQACLETHPIPSQLETRLCVLESLIDRIRGKSRFVVSPMLAREHTRLVNALHDFFPVHAIAPGFVHEEDVHGDVFRRLQEVDRHVAAASRQHLLFSEAQVPWAQPAADHSLLGYQAFSGRVPALYPASADSHR